MLTAREPFLQVAAFHFVVKSCEHQAERFECLYVSLGSAITNIPNIP